MPVYPASRDLNKIGVDFQGLSYILPEVIPESGIWIVDTAELIGALLGEEGNKRGLSKATNLLQIPTQDLHNAGNDAYVCDCFSHCWTTH